MLGCLWARRGDKQRAYENKAERNAGRRCTAASQAVDALREDLLELEVTLTLTLTLTLALTLPLPLPLPLP